MRIEAKKSELNWSVLLGVLGLLPPVGIAMIVAQWLKGGKITFLSILCVVFGMIYSAVILMQLYRMY